MVNRVIDLFWKIKAKRLKFKQRGKYVQISRGFDFSHPENIDIEDYVYIGHNAKIFGEGEIRIARNVIIGPNITIMTSNHNYNNNPKTIPYDEINIEKYTLIKSNVWIGANVSIIPGITIEEGVVIGMGSVVTKDIPRCAVVGGNPAKIIKYRNIDEFNELKFSDKLYLKVKLEK